MLSALRSSAFRSSPLRAFSTSAARQWDVAKLTLVGTLVRDPEVRTTRNEKEFVTYTVATTNYPPPPPDENGERPLSSATFHRVLSFQESQVRYLKSLKKGSKVYVEANFEVRDPEPGVDPASPRGQRQIFLKQETIRLLNGPRNSERSTEFAGETEPF